MDLATASEAGSLTILRNLGNHILASALTVPITGASLSLAACDLDREGFDDLAGQRGC